MAKGLFDDWDYEPSDDNAPSAIEMIVGVISFLGQILLVLVRIAIVLFFIFLFVKLVMFLVAV